MLNQHMTIDQFNPALYRSNLLAALKRDLQRAKNYLRLCVTSIQEAAADEDDETVQMWANQQDVVLQEIESIKQQLKQF